MLATHTRVFDTTAWVVDTHIRVLAKGTRVVDTVVDTPIRDTPTGDGSGGAGGALARPCVRPRAWRVVDSNSNPHGARPVHLIITMIKWIRTNRLSIKNSSLSGWCLRVGMRGRRWRSNPSGKCSQERLTQGTVTSTMRRAAHPSGCARCGAGAGCSAIKCHPLFVA